MRYGISTGLTYEVEGDEVINVEGPDAGLVEAYLTAEAEVPGPEGSTMVASANTMAFVIQFLTGETPRPL